MYKDTNPLGANFNNTLFWIAAVTFFSGALRKWVFTSGSIGNIILLIQLFLPFLISIKHNGLSLPAKNNLLYIYICFLLISALNPMNLTILHGMLGIMLHLGFWWLIAYYYENRQFIDLRPLNKWMIFFCTIEIVLGFIQYQLPADHFLNKYASMEQLGQGQVIASVGNSVRITGTFSYISGYSSFLIFANLLLWSLIRLNYNKKVVAFLFSGFLVVSLMTGSRSSVLFTIIIYSLIIFSEFNRETITDFLKSLFFPIIGLLLLLSINGSSGFIDKIKNSYLNFDERRTTNVQSGEQNQRILGDFNELFIDYRGKYPLFGVGLGATYQGATSIFGTSDYVKEYGYYEGELPRIVLESGFIILLFRIALFFWLISWLNVNKFSKFVCFITFIYSSGIVFNIYNSIFLALGLIFLDNMALHRKYVYSY
jgi:hypothetical protein